MTNETTIGNNRTIRRSVTKMFPSCFLRILAINFLTMVDAMLAGFFFTSTHIAAIGVAAPVTIVAAALMNAIAAGVELGMSVAMGAGNNERAKRLSSLGMLVTILLCTLFLVGSEVFAHGIVRLCGANEPEIEAISALYLRFVAPYFVFLGIKLIFTAVLSVHGCQNDVTLSTVIELVLNVVMSVLLVKCTNLGVAALAIGSWIATFMSMLCCIVSMKRRKLPIMPKLYRFRFSDAKAIFKYGFPTSADNFAEGIAGSVINNIVVVTLGTAGLAVYSILNSIQCLMLTVSDGMRAAMSPMVGIFYGARDKNGIRKTLAEGLKITYIFAVIWVAVIFALLTPIINIYMNGSGAEGMESLIRTGVYVAAAFMPIALLLYVMIGFYEAVGKPLLSLAFAVIPDSIIIPIMLFILVPKLGYNGMWLAYGGCETVFLIIFALLFVLCRRKLKPSADDILFLDESVRDNVPMKDISIRYNNTDISGLSAEIQSFLESNGAKPRTAYMSALCLEELAADFIAHSQITNEKINENRELMDIKLFSDENTFRIMIRNTADRYDPLDFTYDKDDFSKIGVHMAQQVAKEIMYNYIYQMNIVTIDMSK